jgi:hypothetical protein
LLLVSKNDNLFYLGWNYRWAYVEKINVKEHLCSERSNIFR